MVHSSSRHGDFLPNFNSNTATSQNTSPRANVTPQITNRNPRYKPARPNHDNRQTKTTRKTPTPRTPKPPPCRPLAVSLNRAPARSRRRRFPRLNILAKCALGEIDQAVSKWGLSSRAGKGIGNGTGTGRWSAEHSNARVHARTRCLRWEMRDTVAA